MRRIKTSWRSRKLYRIDGRIGHVVYHDATETYLIEDTAGNVRRVDQEFARKAREIEARLNGAGAPPVCPGEGSVLHGISLPQRLWDKIGEPYSRRIAEIAEKL